MAFIEKIIKLNQPKERVIKKKMKCRGCKSVFVVSHVCGTSFDVECPGCGRVIDSFDDEKEW